VAACLREARSSRVRGASRLERAGRFREVGHSTLGVGHSTAEVGRSIPQVGQVTAEVGLATLGVACPTSRGGPPNSPGGRPNSPGGRPNSPGGLPLSRAGRPRARNNPPNARTGPPRARTRRPRPGFPSSCRRRGVIGWSGSQCGQPRRDLCRRRRSPGAPSPAPRKDFLLQLSKSPGGSLWEALPAEKMMRRNSDKVNSMH